MKLNKNIKIREENFGGLLANIDNGKIYKINKSAKLILNLMADYKNTDDLIKNLEKEYELNEKTKKEIREFISLLKEKKIIL
jgi:hypothetical protein